MNTLLSGWRIQLTGLGNTTAYFVFSLVTAVYLAKWGGVMSNDALSTWLFAIQDHMGKS